MMREVEATLESRWALQIKPGSREYLIPRGSTPVATPGLGEWSSCPPLATRWRATGAPDPIGRRQGQPCGAPSTDVARAERPRASHGRRSAACLLRRAVRPVLDFYNTRWALTTQLLSEVDRAQRRMVAVLLGARKEPAETPEGFARRRARQAGQLAAREGLWSERCAMRVIAWNHYLRRDRNQNSWPVRLLQWRGEEWLRQRRVQQNSESVFAGRTATRLCAGRCIAGGTTALPQREPDTKSSRHHQRLPQVAERRTFCKPAGKRASGPKPVYSEQRHV